MGKNNVPRESIVLRRQVVEPGRGYSPHCDGPLHPPISPMKVVRNTPCCKTGLATTNNVTQPN